MAEDTAQPEDRTGYKEGRTQPGGRAITFGEASAFLGFLAVAIYVVGLITLWVPLARTYTGDYSTAWYAVSLIPRTTVIGQGLLLMAAPLLAAICFTGFISFGLLAARPVGRLVGRLEGWTHHSLLLVVILVFGGAGIFGTLLLLNLVASIGGSTWSAIERVLLEYVPGVLTIIILVFGTRAEVGSATAVRRIALFAGLIVMVVGASAVGANRGEPPLPPVHVEASTSIDGDLLTHADRFWYVFDKQGALVAIPDEKVTEVRITAGE